ncbi:MAG TPA: hypothetical protein VFQ71_07495 [Gaiellales bacterium]|jgi:hypothetical protein|nr:hypothetical protein [Gaiellales bacterium]
MRRLPRLTLGLAAVAIAGIPAGCSAFGLAGSPSPEYSVGTSTHGHAAIYFTTSGRHLLRLGGPVRVREPVHCPGGGVGNIPAPGGTMSAGTDQRVSGGSTTTIAISTTAHIVHVFCWPSGSAARD